MRYAGHVSNQHTTDDDEQREYSSPACYLHEFETHNRVDKASRVIHATPERIYRAHMDPTSVASWLPPEGMSCRIERRFVELVADRLIAQLVTFDSDDSAFAGEMKITWTFMPVPEGTRVDVRCENVPSGIRPEDHAAGLASSLENLAKLCE